MVIALVGLGVYLFAVLPVTLGALGLWAKVASDRHVERDDMAEMTGAMQAHLDGVKADHPVLALMVGSRLPLVPGLLLTWLCWPVLLWLFYAAWRRAELTVSFRR